MCALVCSLSFAVMNWPFLCQKLWGEKEKRKGLNRSQKWDFNFLEIPICLCVCAWGGVGGWREEESKGWENRKKRIVYTQGEGESRNHDFQMNSELLLREIACENYKS